jgi:hypothetical protein
VATTIARSFTLTTTPEIIGCDEKWYAVVDGVEGIAASAVPTVSIPSKASELAARLRSIRGLVVFVCMCRFLSTMGDACVHRRSAA